MLPGAQTPVQTPTGTMTALRGDPTDDGSGGDGHTGRQSRAHRLISRSNRTVPDGDDGCASDLPDKADDTVAGRQHPLAHRCAQVYPAMSGEPVLLGRVEFGLHWAGNRHRSQGCGRQYRWPTAD